MSLGVPHRQSRVLRLDVVAEADARGREGFENRHYLQGKALVRLADALTAFDTKPVVADAVARGKRGKEIGEAINQARCHYMKKEMRLVKQNSVSKLASVV